MYNWIFHPEGRFMLVMPLTLAGLSVTYLNCGSVASLLLIGSTLVVSSFLLKVLITALLRD